MILDEVVAFDMGVQRFLRDKLKPLLFQKYGAHNIMIITDPAGVQRAQTDERSAVDIIRQEKLPVRPARTNAIHDRIAAVDAYLTRHVDGESSFLISPTCTRLKAALMGGYQYHKKAERIDKNKHSHVAEALQYMMLHVNSVGESFVARERKVVPTQPNIWL
jgi:hypothetical protein